ncbi:MAG: Uma2 family endonuclease [Bacteroidota bacterium]
MIAVAKRLINRSEYYKMAEVGILKPEDRVELINGEIIEMSPIGSKHAAYLSRITAAIWGTILEKFPDQFSLRIQDPIVLGDKSEPEPYLVVVSRKDDYYLSAHPNASDSKLVIEVSDTTLDYDLTSKARLYAKAEIANYWVIDIEANTINQFTQPSNSHYQERKSLALGDKIDFLGIEIEVSSLLIH